MRKLASLALLTTFALLGGACQEPAGRPPPPPPAPGVSGSLVVHDGDGARGPFRLADLSRLAIDARYVGVEAGPHPVRIDVLTPRGSLYAQYQSTLDLAGAGEATLLRVLEVSGTPIDQFNQVGTWRFVLTVDDGAPLAIAEANLVE